MQLVKFMMAIAAVLLLSHTLIADEAEALEQFARWRSALDQAGRFTLKFRVIHLDRSGSTTQLTRRANAGVCYRDGEFWAVTIVRAPISASELNNGESDRRRSANSFHPDPGFESFTIIDGPRAIYIRENQTRDFRTESMPWKPVSALSPENSPAGLSNREWSSGSEISPVNCLPLFWPAEIDVSKFKACQTVSPNMGEISLVLQRKHTTDGFEYQPRHLPFDQLTAVFRPGVDMPHAIAFLQSWGSSQEIRYDFEELKTGPQANIPGDAFQPLVEQQD